MEGHLTYKIGDVERKFFFGNYALEMTLKHFNASVSDLSDVLGKDLISFLRVFMFHAAAYPLLKKGEILDFTEFDVHEWIDLTGGPSGNLIVVVSKEVFRVLGLNTDSTEQKKSEQTS